MVSLLRHFVVDDAGQDLLEYALVTAFVVLTGAAAWNLVRSSIGTTYGSWDTSVNSLWESPNP